MDLAGAALDGPTATYKSLTTAFETTLTPETRKRAKTLGADIRTDGAAAAAHLLLHTLR
ncbi:hypothetical protein ACGFMK_30480 [Amycolatopsis sp. NPDC049252]|uniref:hypothetical protein n=1 Tax=Amycolatopsis sp. NPDC049252 TaxID=3363933 RepID=UPI003716A5AF